MRARSLYEYFVKRSILIKMLLATIIIVPMSFQNCAKRVENKASQQSSLGTEDQRLLAIMDDTRALIDELGLLPQDPDVVDLTNNLTNSLQNLERLIFAERRPNSDNLVLVEMDYLIYAISNANDFKLERRMELMEAEIARIKQDLGDFADFVLGPLGTVQERIDRLKSTLTDYDERNGFLYYTLRNITDLQQAQQDLLSQIEDNQADLQELFDTQEELENIQDRLCTAESPASAHCTGDDALTLVTTGSAPGCSCVALSDINCNQMFPGSGGPATASRAQCTMFLSILTNHDQQLQQIARIDEQQNQMLNTINNQLISIVENMADLALEIDILKYKVMILDLKAQRAEAGASLQERVSHILAWAERRSWDVNHRFCHTRTRDALNKFDYKVARQNWDFCHEKLTVISRAAERAHIASAFINGALSSNIDQKCSAKITVAGKVNNVEADDIFNDHFDLLGDTEVMGAVLQACADIYNNPNNVNDPRNGEVSNAHGIALAIGGLIQSQVLLDSIAPDFRTAAYMSNKASIAQQLAFDGKTYSEISGTFKTRFNDIDPTSMKNKDTAYGQIDRLFVNEYIPTIFRIPRGDRNGRFPTDASEIGSAATHQAYTRAQINNGANAGNNTIEKRRYQLEVDPSVVGWRVVRRDPALTSTGNPVIDRNGKSRFTFPEDASMKCPIENQHVVIKATQANNSVNPPVAANDYFVYKISYNHVYEVIRPVLSGGQHIKIAGAGNSVNNGTFNGCPQQPHGKPGTLGAVAPARPNIPARWTIRPTQPYGTTFANANQKQCVKFTVICHARQEDRPSVTGLGYYGIVTNDANNNTGTGWWLNNIINNSSNNAGFNRNPIGHKYWVLDELGGAGAQYGDGNQNISEANPFYGNSSRGNPFLRTHRSF